MNQVIKHLLLLLLRGVGTFHIARHVTRRRLRILCYHGIALADEHKFRPGAFMRPETFRSRMAMIRAKGYPVIRLQDAIEGLKRGSLPDCATVITIDDGWIGSHSVAAPLLEQIGFPSTLYVTSYYLINRTQVFNVALAYLLMKGEGRTLSLDNLEGELSGDYYLGSVEAREACFNILLAFAEALKGAELRQGFLERIAAQLGLVDLLRVPGLFRIIGREEASSLPATGMDVQLHTHRHCFPADDKLAAEREISDNRRELAAVVPGPKNHFCYPSGEYVDGHATWLEEWGVESATTCDLGLNSLYADCYSLKRVLDTDSLSNIEIEAELCGLMEIKRWLSANSRVKMLHSE